MKILIVVDMQNDFLEGSLRNEEGIKIIDNVVKKINDYNKNGYDIIATRDTHTINYLNTQEGKNLPVVHCVKNTLGWEINKDIKEALKEVLIFDKPSFGSLDLANYLKEKYENNQNEIEIELVGVCTDICVISNALLIKASLPEVKMYVDASCCAGVSIESHKSALSAMKSCQIEIIGE